jgi:hypothetical protein
VDYRYAAVQAAELAHQRQPKPLRFPVPALQRQDVARQEIALIAPQSKSPEVEDDRRQNASRRIFDVLRRTGAVYQEVE